MLYKIIRGIKKRHKLWKCEKALNLKLLKWQRDYALGKSDLVIYQRHSGKTLAHNLRVILDGEPNDICFDPNFDVNPSWHLKEHIKLRKKLKKKGVI